MRWAIAVILVMLAGGAARAAETITSGTPVPPVSFRNTVQPILAKFGCSSGACHGAAAGKNGFKLSPRDHPRGARQAD
jgi:hypothetical protein